MRIQAVVGAMMLLFWVAGCTDPCDQALKKAEKCWKLANPKKEPNNADPPIFLQVCKQETKKFEKCLKLKDCAEYSKCISTAATDPRAVELLKQAPAAEADMAPEGDMTAAPAPAPAADMPAVPPMQ